MSNSICIFVCVPSTFGSGGVQLRAHACRCVRIREEHRPERDVPSPRRDELERIETRLHTAHADNRHLRRLVARRDGRQRDRPERGTREASLSGAECGPERLAVELQAADRVHERETVGARCLRSASYFRDVGHCR